MSDIELVPTIKIGESTENGKGYIYKDENKFVIGYRRSTDGVMIKTMIETTDSYHKISSWEGDIEKQSITMYY